MKKEILQGTILSNTPLNESYYQLEVALPTPWEEVNPGQFVQLLARESGAFLRRPISICDYNAAPAKLFLLIQQVGKGSRYWATLKTGSTLDIVGPLGHGFTCTPHFAGPKPLLVGGGVGIAPLLYLGKQLLRNGIVPSFLLGSRTRLLLVLQEQFEALGGDVFYTTEDGSLGEKGVVTDHSICTHPSYSSVYTCGPLPMMQNVTKWAHIHEIPSEVSLENRMACGIGACLCCVEDTQEGNKCICTEGPVFRTEQLRWL